MSLSVVGAGGARALLSGCFGWENRQLGYSMSLKMSVNLTT